MDAMEYGKRGQGHIHPKPDGTDKDRLALWHRAASAAGLDDYRGSQDTEPRTRARRQPERVHARARPSPYKR